MKNQDPVLVFVPDLFFQAKIVATAEATGASVRLISSAETLIEECRTRRNSLVILDLSATDVDPISVIKSFKRVDRMGTPRFIGFFSHVDKELERRAREAGCDLVLPKSIFSKRLPEILTGALSIG